MDGEALPKGPEYPYVIGSVWIIEPCTSGATSSYQIAALPRVAPSKRRVLIIPR